MAKSLNLSTRRSKLMSESYLLHHIDLAMRREGVTNLSLENAQQVPYYHGYLCDNYFAKCATKLFHNMNAIGQYFIASMSIKNKIPIAFM